MTTFPLEEHIVGVHIKEDDTKPAYKKCRVVFTVNTFFVSNTSTAAMLLGKNPNRRRAFLQVTTQAIIIGETQAAAQSGAGGGGGGGVGIIAPNPAVVYLETTEELWAVGNNAAASQVTVYQEIERED